jgi:hypothetical protein
MTKYKVVQVNENVFAIKKRVLFFFWSYVTVPNYPRIVWTSSSYRGAKAYHTLLANKVQNKKKTK